MQKQRYLREKEQTSYTISLPTSLYNEVREIAFKNRQSIAYTFQEAIEEYLEKKTDKRR